jgi:hypothetical protein
LYYNYEMGVKKYYMRGLVPSYDGSRKALKALRRRYLGLSDGVVA